VTHAAVMEQMAILARLTEATTDDRLLSWVPFFHDLGLFMFAVFPVVLGAEGHCLPTERFARDPVEWFRLMTSTVTTLTSAPPSGWGAAMRSGRAENGIDLGALRTAIMGAEPVDPAVLAEPEFVEKAFGLRPEQRACAYGLAEAVLCVTATRPGHGVRMDEV